LVDDFVFVSHGFFFLKVNIYFEKKKNSLMEGCFDISSIEPIEDRVFILGTAAERQFQRSCFLITAVF